MEFKQIKERNVYFANSENKVMIIYYVISKTADKITTLSHYFMSNLIIEEFNSHQFDANNEKVHQWLPNSKPIKELKESSELYDIIIEIFEEGLSEEIKGYM